MRRIILSSLIYFGIVFAAGFLLGVVRIFWLVPALGERQAELLEMPVMLVVSYLASGYILNRIDLPDVKSACMAGAIALFILLALEFTVVLQLRGMSIGEYLGSRDPLSGAAYVFSLLVFGALPGIRKFVRQHPTPSD
jgi:hypothetical protein